MHTRDGKATVTLALFASALALTLGASRRAEALSCAEDVRPARGEVVPRNTRIWLSPAYGEARPYRITDPQGRTYPYDRTLLGLNQIFAEVLTPREPLPYPGTYKVELCYQECSVMATFEVRDEIDLQPPSPWTPTETGREAKEDAWGITRIVGYQVPDGAIAVVDVDGAGRSSPLDPGAKIAGLSVDPTLRVGEAPCVGKTFAGEQATLRFGLFDVAGNFSGFGPSTRVEKPTRSIGEPPPDTRLAEAVRPANGSSQSADDTGDGSRDGGARDDGQHVRDDEGGCAVASAGGSGWQFAPLLGLCLLRRRRLRPAPAARTR